MKIPNYQRYSAQEPLEGLAPAKIPGGDFDFVFLFSVILGINFLLGTAFNVGFLKSVLEYRALRMTKHFGIISLTLVDLVVCLVVSPLMIFSQFYNLDPSRHGTSIEGLRYYTGGLLTFLTSWASLSSLFSVAFIAVERFWVFKANAEPSKRHCLTLLLLAHAVALLIALANLAFFSAFHFSLFTNLAPAPETQSRLIRGRGLFFRCFFLAIEILSLVLIVFCYHAIYRIIRAKQVTRFRLNGRLRQPDSVCCPGNVFVFEHSQFGSQRSFTGSKELPFRASLVPTAPSQKRALLFPGVCFSFSFCVISKPPSQQTVVQTLEPSPGLVRKRSNLKRTSRNSAESPKHSVRFARQPTLVELVPYSKSARPASKAKGTGSLESQAVRRTIQPILAYFAMWTPFIVAQIVSMFVEPSPLLDKVNLVAIAIAFLHSSINPIVYLLANKEMNLQVRHHRMHSIVSI